MGTVERAGRLFFESDVFASAARVRRHPVPVGERLEPARRVPIRSRTGVLVVGGGPAGTAAAIAAARTGAQVTLVERYNHLGGLSTGGLVIWIDRMTDWSGARVIAGLAGEILERLPAGEVAGPPPGAWGSRDADTAAHWALRTSAFHGVVTWSPTVSPEWLKTVSQQLALDAGVELVLHAWGVAPLLEGERVTGVVFESKQGRQAIEAGVVVDATGDADLVSAACAAIAPHADATVDDIDAGDIHHAINTSWLFGGVDMAAWLSFRAAQAQAYAAFMARGRSALGLFDKPFVSWREDVALFMGPRRAGFSALNLEDLTQVELDSRRLMVEHLAFYRAHAPGFANAYLMQMAPQIGARHSRRIIGVGRVQRADWACGVVHPDEVGISPSPAPRFANVSVPFSCLVPRRLANVLAPGKHLSSDPASHGFMREIPQCWLTGQAAGVAAAQALAGGHDLRRLPVGPLQRALQAQGVLLRALEGDTPAPHAGPGADTPRTVRLASTGAADAAEPDPRARAVRRFRDPGYVPLCETLADVRRGIDALDERIVGLIAQRAQLVRDATRFKRDAYQAAAPARQAEVFARVRELARPREGDWRDLPDVVEATYRTMVGAFIAREQVLLDSTEPIESAAQAEPGAGPT